MAQIVLNFRLSPTVNHFYNTSAGVGWNRKNEYLDALLVQFFLNIIPTHGGRLIQPSLVLDGICGSKTRDAINKFQTSWNARISLTKPRLDQDAVVAPARGRIFINSHKTWTILALNSLVGNSRDVGLDMYCQLQTHPDCPQDLVGFFASAPLRRPPARRPSPQVNQRLRERGRNSAPGQIPRQISRPINSPTSSRPYNPRDQGVLWAENTLRMGRAFFTTYEYSELLEGMEGTGNWSVRERTENLLQMIELLTGDGFPLRTTAHELTEYLRQGAALGRTGRVHY